MADEPKGADPIEEPTVEPSSEEPKGNEIERGAVATALAGARDRLEKGEAIVAPEEDDAEEEPEEGEAAAEQEGADAVEAEAGEEEGSDAVEAEDEEEPEADAEREVTAEDEEDEEDEADEGDEEPEGEYELVELPPRRPGEDPVKMEAPKELVEHINRLNNGYLRGEDARAMKDAAQGQLDEVNEAKAEIEYIDRELEQDPAGFILKHVKVPEVREEILLQLLTDEGVWENEDLVDRIQKLQRSKETREVVRTRVERDRLKKERDRERQAATERKIREGVRATDRIIVSMIPEDFLPDRATKFRRLALSEMAELGGRVGRTDFSRDEIVQHLDKQGFLDGFGIDPQAARKAPPDNGAAAPGKVKEEGDRGKNPARARTPTAEEARATGERLKEKGERSRSARAYAPEGAGAPAATRELPREGLEARIARVKKHGVAALTGQ